MTRNKKILALFMSILMIVTTVPAGLLNVFAADTFTVSVKDSKTDSAIENATVEIVTKIDGEEIDILTENSFETNSEGNVYIQEIYDYVTENSQTELTLEYTVTADNYQPCISSATVDSVNVSENLVIKVSQNPTVTITGGEGETYLEVGGENKGTQVQVVPGTEITAVIQSKENYLVSTEPKATSVDGNRYTFIAETEDIEIKVTYTPIIYTIDVEVENGEVTPVNGDGKVEVYKTLEETVITFTPEEHYHFYNASFDGEEIQVEESEDGIYTYTINNDEINDSEHNIKAVFAIDTFKVSCDYKKDDQKERGSISIVPEGVSLENVPYGTELTAVFSENENYCLVDVLKNNISVDYGDLENTEEGNIEYRFTVESDTEIVGDFSEVTVLENVDIDKVFSVNGSNKIEDIYYCKTDTTCTISIINEFNYTNEDNETVLIQPQGIKEYKVEKKSDFINATNGVIKLSDNNNITKVQFSTGWRKPEYQINCNIKVRFDSNVPEINVLTDVSNKTNSAQDIYYSVSDPVEKYNDSEYASGVNYESTTVTRSYTKVTEENNEITINEDVEISEEEKKACKFTAEPIADYTGIITYTITIADNVGNVTSLNDIKIENDTEAPTLVAKDKETYAVEFKQKGTSVFAEMLNNISRGKWFEHKMEVTVKATDGENSVGFDGVNSVAQIALVNEDGTVFLNGSSVIDKDGTAVIEFTDIPENATFKGSVYYNICDSLKNGYVEYKAENNIVESWDLLTTEYCDFSDNDGSIIMLEENKPVISEITPSPLYENNTGYEDSENRYICNGDINFDFTITEDFSGLYSYQVLINGNSVKKEVNLGKTDGIEVLSVPVTVDTENIEANADGSYVITVTATDYAGNVAASEDNTLKVYKDMTAPVITVDDFKIEDKNHNDVYGDAVVEDYGFYFKNPVIVSIGAADNKKDNEIASGVKSITIYLEDVSDAQNPKYYTVKDGKCVEITSPSEALEVTPENAEFETPAEFKGQIYAFATDYVNNSGQYVHPDGSIIESPDKHVTESSIEFISVPQAQGTQNNSSSYSYAGDAQADSDMDYEKNVGESKVPLYNGDVAFDVRVTDTYSGIKSISYSVINGAGTTTQTVDLENSIAEDVKEINGWNIVSRDENLVTCMTDTIVISAEENNWNDIVLLIELTDRAGNKSYDYYVFGIDITAPMITVTYDNNSSDTQSATGDYFKADRTATIVVAERNFNTENVKFTIQNAEGNAPKAVDKGKTKSDTQGNGDANEYTYTVTFASDGVYSFNVEYTDRATNKAVVDTKDSVAPYKFVVDKTVPTINVSYNNNEAQNEKYFKAFRTATITIVEHNFDVNRVVITQTSSLAGNAITNPSVSWVNSGDVHIGTINYNADGDYTFDITMTDRAGNKESAVDYGNSVAAKDFTVDTTYSDIVKVEGVKDGDVLGLDSNGEMNVDAQISIIFEDVNFDSYNITLTRSNIRMNPDNMSEPVVEDNELVTSQFIENASGTANGTVTFKIDKTTDSQSNDGIYTLKIEAKDKAGNQYDTDANTIVFSVNRFGSVYTFNNALLNLAKDGGAYTQKVESNLVITEYNPKKLTKANAEITRDAASLSSVSLAQDVLSTEKHASETSWYEYSYIFNASNFSEDGIYRINVSSEDEALNKPQNINYEECEVLFRVDDTKPEITNITGLEKSSVNAENLPVSFEVFDSIGLASVKVYIDNVEFLSIDSFDDITSYNGNIVIPEGSNQKFKLVVEDLAGNITDTSTEEFAPVFEFNDDITVSTNIFVLWYANKPLFWGSIGAVAAIIIASVIIAVVKKRKNDNGENAPTNE